VSDRFPVMNGLKQGDALSPMLGRSIHTLKENAEALVAATRENGLEISRIKLSTWSCLEIRTQDAFTVRGLIIVPSRGWKSLNIWEQR